MNTHTQKLVERIKSLSDLTPFPKILTASRDIGWFLASPQITAEDVNTINIAIIVTMEQIKDSPKYRMLEILDNLVSTFYAGLRKNTDDDLVKAYIKQPLPNKLLKIFQIRGILSLEEIQNYPLGRDPDFADKEEVKKAICLLTEFGLLSALGDGRFYSTWRGNSNAECGTEIPG